MSTDIKLWFSAARPKTLPAGAAPVILGLSIAYTTQGQLNFFLALVTLACALTLQISSNLINDYYDGIRGTDDSSRLGPDRLTSLGLVSASKMKKAFIATLIFSAALGSILMVSAGLPIVIIGLSSLFFAWAYTGGPIPLSHFGLGEIFAFIFFGPVAVWGTYYIQTQHLGLPLALHLGGDALGFLASALMGVNNLRDTEQDRIKGKMTISTLIGPRSMRVLIIFFIVASLICLSAMIWHETKGHFLTCAPTIIFFCFFKIWKKILFQATGRELNQTLANVGKYLFFNAIVSSFIIILINKA